MISDRWARRQERDEQVRITDTEHPAVVRRWEAELYWLIWSALIIADGQGMRFRRPPPQVVCVDAQGRPAMEGFAFGFRWAVEARQIEIAVAASRGARYVKWWPLGRVWWVVEEG